MPPAARLLVPLPTVLLQRWWWWSPPPFQDELSGLRDEEEEEDEETHCCEPLPELGNPLPPALLHEGTAKPLLRLAPAPAS